MLNRVDGGTNAADYANYLIHGIKSGREHSRDELDERICLHGDLDVFQAVANTVDAKEKFYRITLSFKENYISPELAEKAAREFVENMVMSAYAPSEYCWYAEMHKPRIKQVTDQKTGELISRVDHIHIAIPKINIKTGQHIDPLGYVDWNKHYLDAFQEKFNRENGLASPKDNPRITHENLGTMVERYGREQFTGRDSIVEKTKLLSDVYSGKIESYEALRSHLENLGDVRIANKGKSTEYLKFRPPGHQKYIRLEGLAFKKDFLNKSAAERQSIINATLVQKYVEQHTGSAARAADIAAVSKWQQFKSRELRYLQNDSKSNSELWKHYKTLTDTERLALLDNLDKKHKGHPTNDRKNFRSAGEHRGVPPPSFRSRLRYMPGIALANVPQKNDRRSILARDTVLLQSDVHDQFHDERTRRHRDQLRHASRSDGRERTVRRRVDTLINTQHRQTAQAVGELSAISVIKRELSAERLLAAVQQSHGVNPAIYSIAKAADGSDRIVCGRRKLTVSDFLTKELSLPWPQAAEILEREYKAQKQNVVHKPLVRPTRNPALFMEYRHHQVAGAANRAAVVAQYNQHAATQRKALATELRNRIARARLELQRLPAPERQAKLSILKFQNAAARAQLTAQLAELRRSRITRMPYDDWLQKLAQAARVDALDELRKRGIDEAVPAEFSLSGGTRAEHVNRIYQSMAYKVERSGAVTYSVAGTPAIRDTGKRLDVLHASDEAIIAALQMAAEKFGSKLTIHGDNEFRERVATLAALHCRHIAFNDPYAQSVKEQLESKSAPAPAPKRKGPGL